VNEVRLKVGGIDYTGWTSVQVDFSMQTLSQAFALTASDRYPFKPSEWKMRLGDDCTIMYGDNVMLNGWIEDIVPEYDANTHNLKISGRDKLCDLVDCSRDTSPREWIGGIKIKRAIEQLLQPHSEYISLEVDSVVEADANSSVGRFRAEDGIPLVEMINRICMSKAILPVSYGLGGKLTLTRSGYGKYSRDKIKTGFNVKSGRFNQSNRERFSKYICKGQDLGDELYELLDIVAPYNYEMDEVIQRYRPMTVVAETIVNRKQCLDRARWEGAVRAGNSAKLEYTLLGWSQNNGDIWSINSLVQVEDECFDVYNELLIESVSFVQNDSDGTICRVVLVDQRTYDLIEIPVIDWDTIWQRFREVK
jgi:prophage tail gpP-like protein